MAYREGTKVAWDCGNGTGKGKVAKTCTRKTTLTIKGRDVTREASADEPAYRIEQEDGGTVLKSQSELRKAP